MSSPMTALAFACAIFARVSQEVPRGVAAWKSELGNQRARVLVTANADAVRVHLVWRRRDSAPDKKRIVVVDGADGKEVANVYTVAITRESGDIVFQPTSGPGAYCVYYMPFQQTGSPYFPVITYQAPGTKADPEWLERNGIRGGTWRNLPEAQPLQFQARGDWNRPDPMELIAGQTESDQLRDDHPGAAYLIFPEDRAHAIRMTEDLPERWISRGPSEQFSGEAKRGEFLSFQLGLWACRRRLDKVTLTFVQLHDAAGHALPTSNLRCFNQGGTDWLGRPFSKVIQIPNGEVGALWLGAQIPANAVPGDYRGSVVIHCKGLDDRTVRLAIKVLPASAPDAGDADPANLSRLRWLDSTIGLDDEVVAPYTPLKVSGQSVQCLGRTVRFESDGFPGSIHAGEHEILTQPITLTPEVDGQDLQWKPVSSLILAQAKGAITRQTESTAGALAMTCISKMESDGYINYRVRITSKSRVKLDDLRLEIPYRRDMAQFLMGMGRKGGNRPAEWHWDWNKGYANNMVWLGSVDAGLQCKLKGPEESWDLVQLSSVPDAWANGGHGGCSLKERGKDTVLLQAYSGPRTLAPNQTLWFNFGLLITPVKPLDPAHWSQRYDHEFISPKQAKQNGATIINIHQGNDLNPNINYPFLATEKLKSYVKQAHSLGMKVKIYYTVRELSSRLPEIWALRSLGYEVFTDGQGGGDSWLQEHLVSHYKPAWHTPLSDGSVDAAITTVGLSRWHNYYLEGLGWLIKNVGIDGLYLDGIGYDREIMKRVRKVMDRSRPGCLIDFHCGNNFHPEYGLNSCASQFMEHFPYINSLWFGEGFDYNESPDYWLVEISGIPYGLYGEMLQDNGNPWRGMIYGMTARYYSGADPKHIWALWDQFGIAQAKMLGYWSTDCPVHTSDPEVLATAYVRAGKTLVSIASWDKKPVDVKLTVDWNGLGIDPAHATIVAPAIQGFQAAATFATDSPIHVEPGHGWLLLISDEAKSK